MITHRGRSGHIRSALLGVCAISAPACTTQAGAQTAPAAATPDPSTSDQIGDIVVTAQRRTEKLQDVPISAQVLGSTAISRANLNGLGDAAQLLPSVHIGLSGRAANLYIRGTGSGENQSFDQSVGIFIDDIYHGRARVTAGTFLDVDRVEVLKGPQTLFFGNNAIAGAFNIVTKKPGDALEADARALVSPAGGTNGGQFAVEGGIGGPLTDKLGLRIAATYNGQRGWINDVTTGQHLPNERNVAVRATLALRPDSDTDVTLKAEAADNKRIGGLVLQNVNCPPPAPFTPSSFCSVLVGLNAPTGLGNQSVNTNRGADLRLKSQEIVLTANHRFSDLTLSSISGYQHYRFNLGIDLDGTPLTLANSEAPEHYWQFSQELRLASGTSDIIEYMAGAYFQADHLAVGQSITYFFLNPVISGAPPLAPLTPYLPLAQAFDVGQNERTYSGFASLTWKIDARLKLTAGLRGSAVKKSFDWTGGFGTGTATFGGFQPLPAALAPLAGALGLGSTGTVALRRTDHALMPSARLQYQLAANVMTYFSYSRGFKAGGFNFADASAVAANYPFAPEHVDAYEVGLKSELLDRHLVFDVALFRSDYRDLQQTANRATASGTFVSLVQNAAASRSQGVELETRWLASHRLTLSGDVTYLDSRFRDYPGANPTDLQFLQGLSDQDLTGKDTPFSPHWSGSVAAEYSQPIGAALQLDGQVMTIFSSKYDPRGDADPLQRQPGYARIDARLSLQSSNGRWGFDVIGKNLNNRIIRDFVVPQPTALGSLLVQKQQLRNVAFQLRYRW